MKKSIPSLLLLLLLWMSCCSSDAKDITQDETQEEQEILETTTGVAEVIDISVSGAENQYTFSVTILSSDLGCQQYADWWEVIDLDGNLIYRRILSHSHVNEQPFTRTGGPVAISSTKVVYIRAHMNTTSYGNKVFKGSVSDGFTSDNLDVVFAKGLEELAPLPAKCDF